MEPIHCHIRLLSSVFHIPKTFSSLTGGSTLSLLQIKKLRDREGMVSVRAPQCLSVGERHGDTHTRLLNRLPVQEQGRPPPLPCTSKAWAYLGFYTDNH